MHERRENGVVGYRLDTLGLTLPYCSVDDTHFVFVLHYLESACRSLLDTLQYPEPTRGHVHAPQVAAKSKGGDDNAVGKPTITKPATYPNQSFLFIAVSRLHCLIFKTISGSLKPSQLLHSLPWVPSSFPTCARGGMSTKLS